MSADTIRARLMYLRTLSPERAREIEDMWPQTLSRLDAPADAVLLRLPMSRMRAMLAQQIEDMIRDAGGADTEGHIPGVPS